MQVPSERGGICRSNSSAPSQFQHPNMDWASQLGPSLDDFWADLRLTLAAGCPKIAANRIMDLSRVYYPDRIGG
jgi:hypothetical protein